MAHKTTSKRVDPEEYKRFLEAAKKAEASDDPKEFERAFKKVAQARGDGKAQQK